MNSTQIISNAGHRFIVKRYRDGEAAPSLSLSYRVEFGSVERDALIAHLRDYDCSGERYEVCEPGERFGTMFVVGRDCNRRGYAVDRRRLPRVR